MPNFTQCSLAVSLTASRNRSWSFLGVPDRVLQRLCQILVQCPPVVPWQLRGIVLGRSWVFLIVCSFETASVRMCYDVLSFQRLSSRFVLSCGRSWVFLIVCYFETASFRWCPVVPETKNFDLFHVLERYLKNSTNFGISWTVEAVAEWYLLWYCNVFFISWCDGMTEIERLTLSVIVGWFDLICVGWFDGWGFAARSVKKFIIPSPIDWINAAYDLPTSVCKNNICLDFSGRCCRLEESNRSKCDWFGPSKGSFQRFDSRPSLEE